MERKAHDEKGKAKLGGIYLMNNPQSLPFNHLLQVFRYPSIVQVPSKLFPWVSLTFGISWENFQMILCLMNISIPNRTSLTLPRTLYENSYISFYLYEPGR